MLVRDKENHPSLLFVIIKLKELKKFYNEIDLNLN